MTALSKKEKEGWEKSVRLNHGNRDKFIDVVLSEIMPEDDQPTTMNFAEKWQDRMYDIIYTPKILAAMNACPSWMIMKTKYIFVNMTPAVSGRAADVIAFECKPGAIAMIREEDGYHYSHYSDGNSGVPSIDPDHEACKEYALLDQQGRDWSRKKNELRNQLQTVTYDCNTSHQLYEAWPGALKYAQRCFPYTPPMESIRGGKSSVTGQEIDIGIMMSKTSVGAVKEN